MTTTKQKHHIDGFLALLLFGIFSICVLSVLMTGVKVYRGLVDLGQESYQQRTSIQYIATRVHQAPTPFSITVEPFGPVDALTISEVFDGEVYLTRVYCYEGYIRELYCAQSDSFLPQDGQTILPAQKMTFSLSDDLFAAEITENTGQVSTLRLNLRTRQEGAL